MLFFYAHVPVSAREKGLFLRLMPYLTRRAAPGRRLAVEVVIIGNREMKTLNTRYRHKAKTTDVLSFAQPQKIARHEYLGQVFIAQPVAKKQAQELGHSYTYEMAFLFTHGVLHLLGWDHDTEAKDKTMKSMTYKIINEICKP